MNLRRGITLALVIVGELYLIVGAEQIAPIYGKLTAGACALLMAAVYWHVTKPTIPYR